MYEKELEVMIDAALNAEKIIKDVYKGEFLVEIKNDNSPVTIADKEADSLIRKILHKHFPSYGLLTEESKDNLSRLNKDYVFVVDPVDGTKDFVAKDDEFCTNIALIYKHEVVAGVINIPMANCLYFAYKNGGAYLLKKGEKPVRIHVSDKTKDLTSFISRKFLSEKEKEYNEKYKDKINRQVPLGAAIKFCYIAEGKGEIAFRSTSNTKEWDIAAGDIIVKEAGGYTLKPDGTPYKYNREDVYNREGYIIANRLENVIF